MCSYSGTLTSTKGFNQRVQQQNSQTHANPSCAAAKASLVIVGLQDDIQQQREVCDPSLLSCTQGSCPLVVGRVGLLHLPILGVSATAVGAVAPLPGAPVSRPAAAAVPPSSSALPPLQAPHAASLSISALGISAVSMSALSMSALSISALSISALGMMVFGQSRSTCF